MTIMKADVPQKKRRIALLSILIILALIIVTLASAYLFAVRAQQEQAGAGPLPSTSLVDAEKALSVYFLDVGQGDCTLIVTPGKRAMLVDAGPADQFGVLYNLLNRLHITRLDVVVATHGHDDHIGGMRRVIETYEIGSFYMPDYPVESATYQDMLSALSEKGLRPAIALATGDATIDWVDDVRVAILSPFDAPYEDANESSVVLKIAYGNTSVLLAADAGALAERMMLKALPNAYLDADVLKVGHHGSYSSTSTRFFRAVSPGLGVASCGKDNPFGHPDQQLVSLFFQNAIPLLATADYGTIHLLLDGVNLEVVE